MQNARGREHGLSAPWPSRPVAGIQVEPEGKSADIFDGIPNETLRGSAQGENRSIQDRRQSTRFVVKPSVPQPETFWRFRQSLRPIENVSAEIESYTSHDGNVIVHGVSSTRSRIRSQMNGAFHG